MLKESLGSCQTDITVLCGPLDIFLDPCQHQHNLDYVRHSTTGIGHFGRGNLGEFWMRLRIADILGTWKGPRDEFVHVLCDFCWVLSQAFAARDNVACRCMDEVRRVIEDHERRPVELTWFFHHIGR